MVSTGASRICSTSKYIAYTVTTLRGGAEGESGQRDTDAAEPGEADRELNVVFCLRGGTAHALDALGLLAVLEQRKPKEISEGLVSHADLVEAHTETGAIARLRRHAAHDLPLGNDGIESGELEGDPDIDSGRHREGGAQEEPASTDVYRGAKYRRVLVLQPTAAANRHALILARTPPGLARRGRLHFFALGMYCHDAAIICSRLMYVKSVSVAVFPTFPIRSELQSNRAAPPESKVRNLR